MKWYGNDIYCKRGEVFSLDCSIVNDDGTPFRISTLLENAFLLITVASTVYKEDGRYLYRGWVNLADFPKVDDMTILDVDKLPEGNDLIRNRLLRYDGKYYIYNDNDAKYVEYGFRLVHTFDRTITKDWIDRTYSCELSILSGTLNEAYEQALKDGVQYVGVPITDVLFDAFIAGYMIYVEENSSGGGYFG